MKYNIIKHNPCNINSINKGFVSIITTLILSIVITLIVIGFAQVTRNEQTQTLNNELNAQAYYAAETAINDAYNLIITPASQMYSNTGNCTSYFGSAGSLLYGHQYLNGAKTVQFTCLLVNLSPTSIAYNNINAGSSVAFPLNAQSSVGSITITWEPSSTITSANFCSQPVGIFVPQTGSGIGSAYWNNDCKYSLVQLDIVPTNTVNNASLVSNERTYYLQPESASSNSVIDYSSNPDIETGIVGAYCTASLCSATINGLNSLNSASYYVRLSLLYESSQGIFTCVNVYGGSGNSPSCNNATTQLSGAQALIDATGRDQNELKRIQVRVPLTSSTLAPINALESTNNICKQLTTGPNTQPNNVSHYSSACPL